MTKIKILLFSCVFYLGLSQTKGQDRNAEKPSKDSTLTKVDSLKTAIVTAAKRAKIKGDTVEYNTENILLQPNAMVEELLRRLPGLHIDPDGTITYNGEKIQHLLVDGEDIFGSNPTLVTRNFDASKISRIQILDRRSEQAIFTGVDDGARTKTLNLVLKESEKNGYFGRVEAGGNPDGYYKADGALAGFRKKEQFTALGIAANTGVLGFSNGGSGTQVSFLNANADALGATAGTGIPRFNASALHYANAWNALQSHVMVNYQYSDYFSEPVANSQTLQTQTDSIYSQNQNEHSINRQNQHWIYGFYNWSFNDISAFSLTFHGNTSRGENQFESTTNSSFNQTPVNNSVRSIRDNDDRLNLGGDISWRTKIAKNPNRLFSVIVRLSNVNNNTTGYLFSLNKFFQPSGTIQTNDTIDQRKILNDHSRSLGGSFSFTEPIWKGAILALTYGLAHEDDNPLQTTYNNSDGKYIERVDSLSSQLKTKTITQKGTLNLQGRSGHIVYTIGLDWLAYNYRQTDQLADSNFNLNQLNITPRALITYTPNQNTNFGFNYSASTIQPTITQLAPIENNNDPLHITLGNPTLKPTTNQNIRFDFHRFKKYIVNLTLSAVFINNSISTRTTTDSLGHQITQPVNVDGGKTAAFNFSINKKMLGLDAGFHTLANYARTISYVNTSLSRNDAYVGGVGLSLSKYMPDKYSLDLNTNFTYFDQVSSINTAVPIHYWTQAHTASITIFLIKNYELNTNATYTWQEKTSAFAGNTSVLLWNAYMSRNFLHNKLVAKFQYNNILNTNAGITRTNTGNINTQSSTNILGRYWMLSAIYHFDKKFGGK